MSDIYSSQKRSSIMRMIGSRDTDPELKLRGILYAKGYRYRVNYGNLPGKPDLVFTKRRLVIFVHGCFWHQHSCSKGNLPKTRKEFWKTKLLENVERDHRSKEALVAQGWRVLTVWECELKNEAELLAWLERELNLPTSVTPA